jgi:hypothetical protein
LRQRTIAEQAGRARETVNRAIRDLVEWGYLRKRGRLGEDGRRAANFYQVLTDREAPGDVIGTSQAGDDAVTGAVIQAGHGPCDGIRSQQGSDPLLKRPRPYGRSAGEKRKPRTVADAARDRLAEIAGRR